MAVNMSYPKPRSLQTKVIEIARTDSSTVKCVLPKGAIIADVDVLQEVNSGVAAATVSVGYAGATTAILNEFSMATTKVGLVKPGTAVGSAVLGTALDSDKQVIATFTVGSSTSGGTGKVMIHYFVPGPGETVTT